MQEFDAIGDEIALQNYLNKLQRSDEEVNKKIGEANEKYDGLQGKFEQLSTSLQSSAYMQTDTAHLSGMLDFLGELSTSISAKVRQFDLTKSRVMACLEKVENVLELKTCIDGVQQALNNEDFEQAAAHIHRFCKLDDATLRAAQFDEGTSETADGSPSQLEGALESLKESAAKLKQIVREQFRDAVAAHDTASVERFFKIFPLVGLDQEGLESFAKYLADTVRRRCDEVLKQCRRELAAERDRGATQRRGDSHAQSGEKRFTFAEKNAVYFADLSNQLLEFVARLVDAHEPLIETYYGAGNLLPVVRHVQAECDAQMRCLLDAFRAAREMQRLVADVQASVNASNGGQHEDSLSLAQANRAEAKQLDASISELALILAQISLFVKCIQRKLANDQAASFKEREELDAAAAGRQRAVSAFVNNEMRLATEQQLLVGDYLVLEEFYLRESIRKAFALERGGAASAAMATTPDGRAVTSVVDDCFFIAKKCVRRALSSGSVDALCGMLNQLCSLLETDYVHLHYHRLRAGFTTPSNFFDEPERDGKLTPPQRAFIAAFNSLELSGEYLAALKTKLQEEIATMYAAPSVASRRDAAYASAHQKVDTCMAQLDTLKSHIGEAQTFGIEQLLRGAIKRELKRMLVPFESVSYASANESDAALRDDEYDAESAAWLRELTLRMSALLRFFRTQLTDGNFDLLVDAAVVELQQRVERTLLRKTFSRTGGFRFATDVRALVTFFTQQTNWSVRDRFARLSQIAVMLDFDRPDEVLEFTKLPHASDTSDGDSQRVAVWRLTSTETRQFLSLRSDFKLDEINRLPL